MFDLFKRKKKILVVEDEPDILSSLKARLEFEGFEVCVAEDGEAAVEQARKEKPDMIVLDVMLPKMNGFDACRTIRSHARGAQTPVLILTALPQIQDVESAFDAGATDFLNKPFTTERLMTKIHKLLNLDPYQPK